MIKVRTDCTMEVAIHLLSLLSSSLTPFAFRQCGSVYGHDRSPGLQVHASQCVRTQIQRHTHRYENTQTHRDR